MTTRVATADLYDPSDLGPVRVRNRVAMSVHGTRLSRKRYPRYLAERAAGGAGRIGLPAGFGVGALPFGPGRSHADLVGDFDVVPIDPLSQGGIARFDALVIPMLAAQAAAVREHAARCSLRRSAPPRGREPQRRRPAACRRSVRRSRPGATPRAALARSARDRALRAGVRRRCATRRRCGRRRGREPRGARMSAPAVPLACDEPRERRLRRRSRGAPSLARRGRGSGPVRGWFGCARRSAPVGVRSAARLRARSDDRGGAPARGARLGATID